MIYAVLSNFDFVTKLTVKNLNKDFLNAVRGTFFLSPFLREVGGTPKRSGLDNKDDRSMMYRSMQCRKL